VRQAFGQHKSYAVAQKYYEYRINTHWFAMTAMPSEGATICNPPVVEHKLAATANIIATSAKVIMIAGVVGECFCFQSWQV